MQNQNRFPGVPGGPGGVGMGPQQVQINPEKLADLICEKCDNSQFIQTIQFKLLPATHPQNKSGKETPVSVILLMCLKCHALYQNPLTMKRREPIITKPM